ncbi:MauE/DoxX family redox-associated membrane protein [Streptomyces sp. NRRL B-24484]|uniref:MauE/DoxX family redox-associated membrane protein n=1 Tax=Streptomyces sp. NRRL B-24484 TaxID=1463833 RepID=UPI0004BFDE44|nr:MauE/DoxX family redox-associated membrane protein [Streptomyces sp. NRRL B-24484]
MYYAAVACRVLLALVFAASAVSKVRGRAAFTAFEDALRGMRLVPAGRVRRTALLVAAAETALPPLLALPATATAGLLLAVGLLAGLTASVAVTLRRGAVVGCPCFGATAVPLGRRHLVRNLLLTAAALTALAAAHRPAPDGGAQAAALLLAGGAGALAALVTATLDDLAALFAPSR